MTREQIRQTQEFINNQLPYHVPLTLDGLTGPKTRVAIMGWQTGRGMSPTGKAEDVWKHMQWFNAQPVRRAMDKVSEGRIAKLHPRLRQMATDAVNEANLMLTGRSQVRITQGLRTDAEQNALYAQGRTKPGPIVTYAKAGSSYHNFGLGVDFCLLIDGKEVSWSETADFDNDRQADWMEVVQVFKRRGWEWGGDWSAKRRDTPHFQYTFGYDLTSLRKLNRDKDGYVIMPK